MKRVILFTLIFFTLNVKSQSLIKLEDFIKDWIGKKYRFGGESKTNGIDCSAFTQRLYRDVYGIEIPRTCYYQYQETDRIERKNIQIGDIIFFNSKVSPSGWHVGIYIGNDEFIHASNYRDGVKISCFDQPMYERIYKGAGRPKII
jgi:lipoprotein Spr